MRLETSAPRGALHAEAFDKLHRKLEERIHSVRWRVRESHMSLAGGVRPGRVAPGRGDRGSLALSIPRDAAPGRWDIRVRMIRTPRYVNLGVRDYLRDDDRFNAPVGPRDDRAECAVRGDASVTRPGTPIRAGRRTLWHDAGRQPRSGRPAGVGADF
jgi:hypothetical protein